jgi:hypothetical protein
MAKKQVMPKTCVRSGMWLYENKAEIIERIHLLNLLIENNLKSVQKPSQKYYSPINGACIKMLVWNNNNKVWGFGLVYSLLGKTKRNHLI